MARFLFLTVFLALSAGCSPVHLIKYNAQELAGFNIPASVVFIKGSQDRSSEAAVAQLQKLFIEAGFDVKSEEDVTLSLSKENLNIYELLKKSDYKKISESGGISGLIIVRELYGTELSFIDLRNGVVRASGCWETNYFKITNDVMKQLSGGENMNNSRCLIKE